MKRWMTPFLTLILAVSANAQHTGYWKFAADSGAAEQCRLVENEKDMIAVLKAVGVDTRRIPIVNWKDDCAIIIAPREIYENASLAFFGLAWHGNRYLLEWGWKTYDSGGEGHRSFGSVSGEALVVSFKHGMHAANAFQCASLGVDPEE